MAAICFYVSICRQGSLCGINNFIKKASIDIPSSQFPAGPACLAIVPLEKRHLPNLKYCPYTCHLSIELGIPAFAIEHAEVREQPILELRLPRRPCQRVAGELACPPVGGQQLK